MRRAFRNFRKFAKALLPSLFGRRRFVRLSWWQAPRIVFLDKEKRRVFSVRSRHYVDSLTADEIFTQHNYDLRRLRRYDEIMARYQFLVSQNIVPLIIDCGANAGYATRYLATEFPEAHIIGVEPDAGNIALARLNTERYTNVTLLQSAIGAAQGFVSVTNNEAGSNAFRVERSKGADIPVATINQLVTENKVIAGQKVALFLVKIDIEGFEEDLFSSNLQWLKSLPLLVIELHDWMLPGQARSQNFLKAVSKYPRDFVYIHDNVYSIISPDG